ncbi:hypothetical protein C2S52_019718 [Perilla frutescens var. hirtella]|nr:hypothetical protein C2S52_019718 [Perilla frutescens var. hirtella]KAH6806040.1 hypothetical protein C2S51_030871 [Perilla frutescens var. frutescens]
MRDNEKIVEYFTRVSSIINQMESNGEIIMEAQKVVEKILRSLPKKFDHVVVAIEESQDLSSMSLEGLQGRLEAHEVRILQRNPQTPSQDQALKFQFTFTGGRGSYHGRGRGHYQGRGGNHSSNP